MSMWLCDMPLKNVEVTFGHNSEIRTGLTSLKVEISIVSFSISESDDNSICSIVSSSSSELSSELVSEKCCAEF